mmetsp:Transcript_52711/g.155667  ORF Transcript_52711/g.155667 Transcript_52711/m.155667 type:complete len:297 (-) Transcript_52711:2238-3128(-)
MEPRPAVGARDRSPRTAECCARRAQSRIQPTARGGGHRIHRGWSRRGPRADGAAYVDGAGQRWPALARAAFLDYLQASQRAARTPHGRERFATRGGGARATMHAAQPAHILAAEESAEPVAFAHRDDAVASPPDAALKPAGRAAREPLSAFGARAPGLSQEPIACAAVQFWWAALTHQPRALGEQARRVASIFLRLVRQPQAQHRAQPAREAKHRADKAGHLGHPPLLRSQAHRHPWGPRRGALGPALSSRTEETPGQRGRCAAAGEGGWCTPARLGGLCGDDAPIQLQRLSSVAA